MTDESRAAIRTARLNRLVSDRINLAAQGKQVAELIAQVDAEILDLLEAGEEHAVAQGSVRVVPPTPRFSPTLAAKVLPPDLLDKVATTTVVAAKAREHLPPALYDLCREATGKPSVRVAGVVA